MGWSQLYPQQHKQMRKLEVLFRILRRNTAQTNVTLMAARQDYQEPAGRQLPA